MRCMSLARFWGSLAGILACALPAVAQQPAAAPFDSPGSEGVRAAYTSAAAPTVAPAPQAPGVLPAAHTHPLPTEASRLAPALTPADAKPRTKLVPPGGEAGAAGENRKQVGGGAVTVVGSLGLVLGLFLTAVWVMRRGLPQQNRTLPKEAVETLGRIPFPGRQQGQLLRLGNKLILVSFSGAGAHVIAEVTDPVEVDRLAGLCAQNDAHGAVRSFREVVDQFFREKPGKSNSAGRISARREGEDDVA